MIKFKKCVLSILFGTKVISLGKYFFREIELGAFGNHIGGIFLVTNFVSRVLCCAL